MSTATERYLAEKANNFVEFLFRVVR
jgi:hypothetical protein